MPEVEVAEDHAEEGEDGVDERAKVVHLRPEQKVAQLREGQEYDEEHNRKTCEIAAGLKEETSVQFVL